MKRTSPKKLGSAGKVKKQPEAKVHRLDSTNPNLRYIGGSNFDAWNNTIASQAAGSIWQGRNLDAEHIHDQQVASLSLLAGISPNDKFEGMLAVQLLASHNAAMECYLGAMIAEQTLEGRKDNLVQANKLSRTHAALLEALNRHRGKGQQKVTVEHVHVLNGGQAIVGNVVGGGALTKSENQPHALGYAPGQTLWSDDAEQEALSVSSDAKRSMPAARRKVTGPAEEQPKCLEAWPLHCAGNFTSKKNRRNSSSC